MKNDNESTYTVLLCVDYDEAIIRRYHELLRYCEIQGSANQNIDGMAMTKRSLRLDQERIVKYDLILALGAEDATDVAWRIYHKGGQIAVAFFDLRASRSDMSPVIRAVKEAFPRLICAVATSKDNAASISNPSELFSSPNEWLYFLNDYSPEQMEQLIAHLISSAVLHREKEVALAKNEATLDGLRQILESSPELLKKQSETELGQLILRTLRNFNGGEDTYLLVLDSKTSEFRYLAGTGRFQNEAQFQNEFQLRRGFYQDLIKENKVFRLEKVGTFVPLLIENRQVGILFLDREHRITQGTGLLDIFTHHIAFALENRRFQVELEQKQAWEHELQLASRIQNSLLPKTFPPIPGLTIYGLTRSAKEIGGDYFDVIGSENRFYLSIGDVSGKGVPAGLIMSELRSFVRCLTLSYSSPKEILLQSAKLLLLDIAGSGKFVSMLLFQWNGRDLLYSSAGHEHILHYHIATGACDAYRSGGVVLGVDFRNFSRLVQEKRLEVQIGDLIVLFTDGATEAKNTKGEMYKLPNLQKTVEKYHDKPIKELVESILKDILDFIGEAEQHDDITLLAMRFEDTSALRLSGDEDKMPSPAPTSQHNISAFHSIDSTRAFQKQRQDANETARLTPPPKIKESDDLFDLADAINAAHLNMPSAETHTPSNTPNTSVPADTSTTAPAMPNTSAPTNTTSSANTSTLPINPERSAAIPSKALFKHPTPFITSAHPMISQPSAPKPPVITPQISPLKSPTDTRVLHKHTISPPTTPKDLPNDGKNPK